MNPTKQIGFTLIELVIAVAIVGILASIAYPSYTESVRKSRRSDAHVALMDTAQQLERCFTEFNAYNNTGCGVVSAGPAISLTSPEGYYTIANTALSDSAYTITATSAGVQTSDTDCATLSLTQTGNKTSTGGGNCW